jgi:23S rRNA pseudouridine955/2504/2580 synthase
VLRQDVRKRLSLLSLKPLTGRTHQLRVQAAHHQLPIIGDRTYGDFKINAHAKQSWGLQRLMLHAEHIQMSDPASGLELDVDSKVPPEFVQLFDN